MSRADQRDFRGVVQCVQHWQIALAGHAEDAIHSLPTQGLDQNLTACELFCHTAVHSYGIRFAPTGGAPARQETTLIGILGVKHGRAYSVKSNINLPA